MADRGVEFFNERMLSIVDLTKWDEHSFFRILGMYAFVGVDPWADPDPISNKAAQLFSVVTLIPKTNSIRLDV